MWGQGSGGARRIHRIPGFAGVVLFHKLVLRGRGGGDQDRRTEGHGKDLHETWRRVESRTGVARRDRRTRSLEGFLSEASLWKSGLNLLFLLLPSTLSLPLLFEGRFDRVHLKIFLDCLRQQKRVIVAFKVLLCLPRKGRLFVADPALWLFEVCKHLLRCTLGCHLLGTRSGD